MLFYALVACALALRRAAGLAAILLAIVALAVVGQVLPPASVPLAFWTDPIVLEFGLGVAGSRGWLGVAGARGGSGWPCSCSP